MSQITVVEQFAKLFRGREDAHGEFTPLPDGEKKVVTAKTAATAEHWQNHINGVGPFLGAIPLRSDGMCYFGAIDVDCHEGDGEIDLVGLDEKVRAHRLPLVVCRSKSGGAHLYIFCREPVQAKTLINKMKAWLRLLGLPDNTEIFPKQVRAKVGNWINLPYYDSDNTNRYAIVGGVQADLTTFITAASLNLVTEAVLEGTEDGGNHPFIGGPPCLIALHEKGGISKGARNRGLYNVALYFKMVGDDDWKEKVRAYNKNHLTPPLSDDERESCINSTAEHPEYKYSCDEEPIIEHCKKSTCLRKRYGIGYWRSEDIDEAMPNINSMLILETEPPRYFLNIEGVNTEMGPDQFLSYSKFRLLVMTAISRIPPVMRQYEWEDRAQLLLNAATHIAAPEDAGVFGQFKLLVHEFLGRRRANENKPEELERGHPFEKDGTIFFRSRDLLRFLADERFRDYTNSQVYSALHKVGAGTRTFRVKDNIIRAWYVPVPKDNFNGDEMSVPRKTVDTSRSF